MGLRVKGILCPPFPAPPHFAYHWPPVPTAGAWHQDSSLFVGTRLPLCVVPGARVLSGRCLTLTQAQIPTICPWGPDSPPPDLGHYNCYESLHSLDAAGQTGDTQSASVTLVAAILICAYSPTIALS